MQADDVMHRQISTKADLISLDDAPPRAWANRLLQECGRYAWRHVSKTWSCPASGLREQVAS